MRMCRITPALDIVTTETAGDGKGATSAAAPLFRGYPGRKVRMARAVLRTAGHSRGAGPLAALALRLCREELVETLLACDPDAVDLSGVVWAGGVRRALAGRFPQWLEGAGTEWPEGARGARVFDSSAKVSIVLPIYNVGPYLHQSIESCLVQSHKNIEVIVVDDGSADDISVALARYDDPRVSVLHHDRNRGIAAALNTGFAAATGEYLTWTSDDNYYDARAIEIMTGFLQTYRDVDLVYADMMIVDDRGDAGTPTGIREARPPAWFWVRETNPVGACFLYHRRVYEALGDYDTDAFLVEDYEYWLRVAKRFRMQRLFRSLYYYRYHPHSLTVRHSRSEVVTKLQEVRRRHGAWTW